MGLTFKRKEKCIILSFVQSNFTIFQHKFICHLVEKYQIRLKIRKCDPDVYISDIIYAKMFSYLALHIFESKQFMIILIY